MKVAIRRHIPLEKLIEEIRRVPLKNSREDGTKVFPYEKAKINLREMYAEELNPGSKYLLQPAFEFQINLRNSLIQDHGIDSLKLSGGYEVENEKEELWLLIPPIIEVSEETVKYIDTRGDIEYNNPIKTKLNIIVDGLHRSYVGKIIQSSLSVIHIFGVPDEYPFYALANQWNEIKIMQDTPQKMEEKKNYRRKDSYALYRDFDILGCGKQRGTGKGND